NTLNITYPLNGTNHTSNVSEINYSVNDNGILTACWYSNNSGIWNSSVQNASANFTSVRTREGLNNFTIYCSDSAGNENSTFTVFVKDSINPPVEIKSPVNGSIYYANQSILINMESSDSNLSILSYDWNGTQNYTFSSLTYINFTSMGLKNITFYANDTHGNMNTTLIIINVTNLTTNSYIINDSTFNVSENITKIIVPYNTSLQNVTLTNSSRNISFDLSQLLNNNIVTIGPNNFTLKTIDTFNYTAIIQANTNISGNSSWDGTIVLPRLNTTASSFTAPSGTTNAVIELGSSFELNFTSPVKIIIGGMSGKRASWSRGTTTLTDIATACDSATSPTNIDATTTRECYIDSGSDLVIWTYHFTNFAAYTLPAATTTASTGGSTSSGSTSTTYTISDSKLNSGYTKAFMKGDKARFVLFNKTHYFKVISVSDSEIEYNLTSQGKLPVTNDYKVDLNSDSIYDIKISYTSYNNISKRANLKIIKISEDVFTKVDDIQKSVDIVTGTTSDDTTTSKDTTSDIVGNVVDQAKYNFESWIVAVVIIISIIIFVVLIYYYYRNHTKKKIKMLMSTMPTY
ncbi:hypothetical protein GOV12_04370, partial [Candidatus Pacearchaeota archaeon]|nr:hypothetical protein [Candidatus Pacearchaeota archaeon]